MGSTELDIGAAAFWQPAMQTGNIDLFSIRIIFALHAES